MDTRLVFCTTARRATPYRTTDSAPARNHAPRSRTSSNHVAPSRRTAGAVARAPRAPARETIRDVQRRSCKAAFLRDDGAHGRDAHGRVVRDAARAVPRVPWVSEARATRELADSAAFGRSQKRRSRSRAWRIASPQRGRPPRRPAARVNCRVPFATATTARSGPGFVASLPLRQDSEPDARRIFITLAPRIKGS